MNRLPPGQIETGRFPVVGERKPSADLQADPATWSLTIIGQVGAPQTLSLEQFMTLANKQLTFDIHCVTSWTRFDSVFTGIPLRELLDAAQPGPEARFVSFEAYSDRGHHTSLPLDFAMDNAWVVHSFDGQPLTTEHGGPVRVVTPGRYFYKSVKWLKTITLLEEDRLGWWEQHSSYHNIGNPETGAERFSTGSLRPEQVDRFHQAQNYDKYRGRVLLGLDLRHWAPASLDLRRLCLKNCDLRGIDLAGADLRGCNLSLSDLGDADLSGADLSGSDLEGANFVGADLRGARLDDSALSATRFTSARQAADVAGMTYHRAWGLVEDQEDFLEANAHHGGPLIRE